MAVIKGSGKTLAKAIMSMSQILAWALSPAQKLIYTVTANQKRKNAA